MLILRIDSLESHRNLNPELRSHMTITLSLKWEFPKIYRGYLILGSL